MSDLARQAGSAAKKAFCPPFKKRTLPSGFRGAKQKSQLEKRAVHYVGLCTDDAHTFADSTCPSSSAALGEDQEVDDAARVQQSSEIYPQKETLREIQELNQSTDILHTSSLEACPTRCRDTNDGPEATSASPHHAGRDREALVSHTLYWVEAAQRAVQHLAVALAEGDVERVLAELHLSPSAVLFSVEDGDFVQS